jgi:hypothetical protein
MPAAFARRGCGGRAACLDSGTIERDESIGVRMQSAAQPERRAVEVQEDDPCAERPWIAERWRVSVDSGRAARADLAKTSYRMIG